MASGQTTGLKRLIFWEFPRASWQYDLIVAAILAFIFLTPRDVFRDQPRAQSVVQLPAERGANVFWVEPDLLQSVSEPNRAARVEALLKARYGKRETVVRLEPVYVDERELRGYMAFTRP